MGFDIKEHPHRRFNPLTESWVLVSPHRSKRPWQGQVEKGHADQRPEHDPDCYLCPGNTRANGEQNPTYDGVYAFTNDFSALLKDTPPAVENSNELFQYSSQSGICRVICFSPRHDLTIPEMDVASIRKVVDLWADEYQSLGSNEFINYVQIFENKGSVMGCSNPHPHGQIWSQNEVPQEPAKKTQTQKKYFEKHGKSLLSDYLDQELKNETRIVVQNDHFVALVPFWAVWPFETMIISRRHFPSIAEMNEAEKEAFADIYKKLTVRYDNLFEVSFPYSAGIHQAPTDGKDHSSWHFHMCFYPPLLRSATVKKFMVGYEMLGEPQRDITPEGAAERLKMLSDVHYRQR